MEVSAVRWRRWLASLGGLLSITMGTAAGLFLALTSGVVPAGAAGLEVSHVVVVSWRGGRDAVPPDAQLSGWQAPIFYTTPEEGAEPGGLAGLLPTGVWAPGDSRRRTLVVRNVDPQYAVRLEGVKVALTGDLDLAAYYHLRVINGAGTLLFDGSLREYAAEPRPFASPVPLGKDQTEQVEFEVTLDRQTDQRLQGRTVKADFTVFANYYGNPPEAGPGGPYAGVEGSPVILDGFRSFDPDGGTLTFGWYPGDGLGPFPGVAYAHTYGDDGVFSVLLEVTDSSGVSATATTTATIQNADPVLEPFPGADLRSGQIYALDATFTDQGWLDTHTAAWPWGNLRVVEAGGAGRATGSQRFLLPGIYEVCVTVRDDDGGSDSECARVTVRARSIAIDIHPNSWPNPIRPGSSGTTPVAVNGSAEIDVSTLDWSTARFGPEGAPALRAEPEDWNGDGFPDLVLHFGTAATGITCGMTEAGLSIADLDGIVYEGTDWIKIPGCGG